jgi:hypothetical protein
MINYITIPKELSPKDADNIIKASVNSGADCLFLLHESGCEAFSAAYREKLLSLFRSALRHKVKIYLADDSFTFSGTAFSLMASVPDLRARLLSHIPKSQLLPEEEPLFEKGDFCIVARLLPENESYPYNHYPDLTNAESAEMAKDFVYSVFLKEYKKFKGYELKGFVCLSPCFLSPLEEYVPYCKDALENLKADPFSIFEDENVKKDYVSLCREAFEKNYLLPIRDYCEKEGVEFSVTPYGEKGASEDFCERESALSPFVFAHDFTSVISSFLSGKEAVLEASSSPYFKSLALLRKYLSSVPKSVVTYIDGEEISLEKDEMLLVNNTDEAVAIKMNIPKNKSYFVKSPENGSLFILDEDFEYVFYPFGFMHIISQSGETFEDYIPSRFDGVEIRKSSDEFEESTLCDVEFEEKSITLPDEPLYGKQLCIKGDFSAVEVKIGAMEKVLLSPPFSLSLFEFCRGAQCGITIFGGKASNVSLLHKKC